MYVHTYCIHTHLNGNINMIITGAYIMVYTYYYITIYSLSVVPSLNQFN